MHSIVNSKSNLTLFTSLGFVYIRDQMAGETSGPGPSEQEIRMVALERKFDELLSFVQLIAKRNPDDENQRKEDDRDANNEEPEGHSNANTTPPPPTPPKPEGKDS
jgi:hypothetical protein